MILDERHAAPGHGREGSLAEPSRHTIFEDGYAWLTGCTLIVIGLAWLQSVGMVTGGTAGLALLFSYLVPLPAGVLFTLINIPFFLLAGRTMGRGAIGKAVGANLLLSGLAVIAPEAFSIEGRNIFIAAVLGGSVIGTGLLILARHQVGIGGIGMLALSLQKSRGWNVGRTQLAADILIVSSALPLLDMEPPMIAASILSAVSVAGVLIVFHRPGRYTGY